MSPGARSAAAVLAGWAALLAASLLTRPLIPVDETRYVGVAWEMWTLGDFLVPHLNGSTYSHKPPLLFWLIHAGWWLLGVSDWWPRLLTALAGLASLGLTARLARVLWPDRPEVARLAPLLLLGTGAWTAYTTLTMFDTLLTACTLVAMLGLAAAPARGRAGFVVFGVGLGLGILAKGPVVVLYTLPAALAAPLWTNVPVPARRWYRGVLGAVCLGAAMGLAWALTAAAAGGAEYAEALLWKQSAGRVVESFAHRRAWWWYLAILPVVLFPWLWWPTLWRAAARWLRAGERPARLLVWWTAPALALLMLVSGKQVHYLLPLLPALSLVAARALTDPGPARSTRAGRAPPAAWLLGLGAAWAAVATGVLPLGHWWNAALHPAWAAALAGLGLALLVPGPCSPARAATGISMVVVVAVVVLHLALVRTVAPAYDVRPVARRVAALQASGAPVANVGAYHGQYHFYGRLRRPLEVIFPGQVDAWRTRNPGGHLVRYPRDPGLVSPGSFSQRYRGRYVTVEPGAAPR